MNSKYDRLESQLKQKENPRKSASVFSILFFSWVREILAIGQKRPLENDDLFPLLDEDKTQTSTEKLHKTWNEETIPASNKTGNGHRLLKALFRAFPFSDYLFILSLGLLPAVCNVLQPVFLSLLLPELTNSHVKDSSLAYIYATGLCMSSFVRAVCAHQFGYYAQLMALRWKSATIGIVYKQVLRLSRADLSNLTSGFVINVIASDLQRFEKTVIQAVLIIQASLELCSISFLMYYLFGWRPLTGVLFLMTVALYYGMMGRACAMLRSKISKVADQRVDIMNSIISGIRTVKMYAWEWPFMERVQRIRRTLYPKDLIIGAVTLICTFVLFGIAQSREQRIAKLKSQYPSLVPIAVIAVAVLIIYALGSILVFIWGVTVPLAVILLHAATRKRNIKNKFANVVEVFKEDVTPMTIILSKICTIEKEQQASGMHQN